MPPWEQQWPRTHYDLISHYHAQYDENIRTGKFQPFLYPWGAFGAFVVIIYLLIPHQHRPWLKKARFLAFAWILGFAAYSIICTRARGVAPAIGLGLVSAWSVIYIMAIIVVNDAQTDFQRIERTEGVFGGSYKEKGRPEETDDSTTDRRHGPNGIVDDSATNGNANPQEHLGPSKRHGEFAWQPYPLTPFIERLDWVLDAFCNFRGAGWNWRTSSIAPPPKWVLSQARRNTPNPPTHALRIHSSHPATYPTRRALLISSTRTFIIGYLILDLLKTLVNHDPYFWGIIDRAAPSIYPAFLSHNPTLLKMWRLMISMLSIKHALQTIFSLAPLFFSGILGPSIIGARAEPWMYAETWGPYSMVFERGIAGWWSGWWHQTFRFAFEEPSRKLVQLLGMNQKSPLAKLLQLFVAFGLSGILHACGSYTCAGSTRPIRGSMTFFLLQALGIFIEVSLTQLLRKSTIQQHIPERVMHTFTFIYVHFWFYHTAPLLCDDFAKGGVWLFEPIPVSIFRGMGLGVEGDGWWCWSGLASGQVVRWHSGGRWWRSGVAF